MALLDDLLELLLEATEGLPEVTVRPMFGCHGLFAAGNVFGLIWKDGRIGLKLPDPAAYAELMLIEGSSTWSPGGKMVMGSWVLVPEAFHDDHDALEKWATRAHAAAIAAPPKVPKLPKLPKAPAPKKKPAAKKPAAKKSVARAPKTTAAKRPGARPAKKPAKTTKKR